MKRVCTLRKVLRSLSKVLLEKLFYRSYIVAFYRHSVLIVFIISPARRYAMEWKANPKYLHEKKFGSSQILVQSPNFYMKEQYF